MNRKKKMKMTKIRRALLDVFSGKSHREVADQIGVSHSVVDFWWDRGKELKLTAIGLKLMSDVELEAQFLQKPGPKLNQRRPINWDLIGAILQKSSVEEAYLVYCNTPGDQELPLLTLSGVLE